MAYWIMKILRIIMMLYGGYDNDHSDMITSMIASRVKLMTVTLIMARTMIFT